MKLSLGGHSTPISKTILDFIDQATYAAAVTALAVGMLFALVTFVRWLVGAL